MHTWITYRERIHSSISGAVWYIARGHQLPKKGVRILKSLEFTLILLISRDFPDFKTFQEIS